MSVVDAAEIADGGVIEADLCIVGAGAAGLAMAVALEASGLRLLVLESGGLSFEPAAHALAELESSGAPLRALQPVRQRRFGGTTSTWHGRLAPLDDLDFEPRAWVPHSGWPIPVGTVSEYLPRAAQFFGLRRPGAFAPESWGDDPTFQALGGDGLAAGIHLWPHRVRTAQLHLRRLRRAEHVRVVLHASAARLALASDGASIAALAVRGLGGSRFTAIARAYVLACGGLENPHLLLLSRDASGCGLGNRYDAVGRFYMSHPRGDDVARLYLKTGRTGLAGSLTEHRDRRSDQRVQFFVKPHPERQRREQLLNACSFFYPVRPPRLRALGEALADFRRAPSSRRGLALARRIGAQLPLLARLAARWLAGGGLPVDHLVLVDQVEQVPDPASRVTLGERCDRFGDPVLRLHWRIGAETTHTLRRLHELLAAHVSAAGIGRLESSLLTHPEQQPPYTDASHPMGTTRMSDDPRLGVVDRDCRVHGVANLYVAGSSVFPTGGQAPPTLTIVCLALRLADHLRCGLKR